MQNLRQELDRMLCETAAEALAREKSSFDQVDAGRRRVVIFGAGRLGRKILKELSDTDLEPVAFADNNPKVWGQIIEGLPVFPPHDAADKFRDTATFVIAVWHPSNTPLMSHLLTQLRGLRCAAIPFPVLFWRHPEKFLPYFFWDLPSTVVQQRSEITAIFDLLHEDVSRHTFASQIRLRLHADFDCLGSPAPGAQYFPGVFSMSKEECFVDCGAYTGDTIQSFMCQTAGTFRKVIAFEADPAVLPGLSTFVRDAGGRVGLHRAAVGANNGIVHFAGDGIGGGSVNTDNGIEVRSVRLDDVLREEHVSFVKMDIEGTEIQALEGAQRVIWRDRPVLAICGYHTPDHLWRVPQLLKTLAPDFSLFLRAHCADGLDAVWYAVPEERRVETVKNNIGDFAAMTALLAVSQGSIL